MALHKFQHPKITAIIFTHIFFNNTQCLISVPHIVTGPVFLIYSSKIQVGGICIFEIAKNRITSAPIGALEVKFEIIMTDQLNSGPSDRPNDGHEKS